MSITLLIAALSGGYLIVSAKQGNLKSASLGTVTMEIDSQDNPLAKYIPVTITNVNYFFQERVSCDSDDMRRHWCRVDTRGGVRLYKQKSDSPCIQGRSWGYNRDGIWVDRGCRAEFEVGREGGGGGSGGQTVSCDSDDMRRHWCRVDTRGGVRLLRQKSDSPCVRGSTWGYNRDGIWVDRGCRAEFQVGRY
jgi:Protein of unknown function (DUF3011)